MEYEDIFSASYTRVLKSTEGDNSFFDEFYNDFIASSDEVARKFKNTDMKSQKDRLKLSIHFMLKFYINSDDTDQIIDIAISHNKNNGNIRPHLYDIWLDCLVKTVEKFDVEFNDGVEQSWRNVMTVGIEYMKFKYDDI